jgi:hypothetical protein
MYQENVDKVRKLKPSLLDIEILKGRLLEEQQRRERAEAQLSKLKGVEARAQKLELQLAACTAFPGDKFDGSSCVSMPRRLAEMEKYVSNFTVPHPFPLLCISMLQAFYILSNRLVIIKENVADCINCKYTVNCWLLFLKHAAFFNLLLVL